MTVKKAFEPIIAILTTAIAENPKVKAADLMERIIAEASAKVARGEGASFMKDTAGNVVAIHDYYFKRWMPLVGDKAVDFGTKKGTTTGFNTMCKVGVSHWTKQQSVADKANVQLLEDVKSGALPVDQIEAKQNEIEVARKAIAPAIVEVKDAEGNVTETKELGFATEDEVKAYLASAGVTLAA